jgi:hypothetical protein
MFEIDKSILRPEASAEFVAGHDLAGCFEQGSQNLKWLSLQPDLRSVLAQYARFQIDLEGSKVNATADLNRSLHGAISTL